MAWFSTGPGLESHHIVNGFDWGRLGPGTVVDVGGSYGSTSMAIARTFPSLHCIVQDRREVIEVAYQKSDHETAIRVVFMEHDFFAKQPIMGADVYLLRWILHDWSVKYALQILRGLVPALKKGSRIVVCEHVLPEPGSVTLYQERAMR